MGKAFNGRRVRSWCVDSDMSYEDLAKSIGVAEGTLKAWVYGQRSISFDHACAIANVFKKPVDDLRITEPKAS